MSKATLSNALPIIAKTLGHKLGVEVVIGAPRAMTDGRTICLPALPADDTTASVLAHGYIDHESAHVRFTDWQALPAAAPFERRLINVLEDIRIEQAIGQRYPGARANLARLVEHLVGQGEFAAPAADAHPAAVLLSYWLHLLRAEVLAQSALGELAQRSGRVLQRLLSEDTIARLTGLALTIADARSTADVVVLARRLIAELDTLAARKQPAVAPSLVGLISALSNESPSPEGWAPDVTAAASDPVGKRIRTATERDCGPTTDLGQHLAQLLDRHAVPSSSAVVVMAEYDPVPVWHDAVERVRSVRAATVRLRRRLTAQLQARDDMPTWQTRRGRRLYGRALYRLQLDNPTVFVRTDEQPAPATAVALLLDRSRSMRRRLATAVDATLALALALAPLPGIALQVAAFPGSRAERLCPLLRFEQDRRGFAGRFHLTAHGETPLPNALWRIGYDLLQRREPRRLAIVITDGLPQDAAASRDVIARCRASGIEVLAVGIGDTAPVAEVFGSAAAVSIHTVDELAPALFRLLGQQLVSTAD